MIKLKRSNITIICNLIFVLWEIIICFGKRIGSSRDHLFIFQFYYVNLLTYKNSGGKVTILDLFTRKNNNNNKKKTTISFSWALSILLVKLFSFTFQPPHVLCPWCYFNLFLRTARVVLSLEMKNSNRDSLEAKIHRTTINKYMP